MKKIAFHDEEELKRWKLANYESYEYSKLLECPECGRSGELNYRDKDKSILVGWCETPQGFMYVKECPYCGTKYRFHGTTSERFNYYGFLQNFSLTLYLYQKNHRDCLKDQQ